MNSKNRKIYEKIFTTPILSNINWSDIESLFLACGASISEGNGSRVRVMLNGVRAVFHRPHPEDTTDKGAVKAVSDFLQNAKVKI